ncbi:MAG: hypothetical protein IPG14_10200 [Dehalococcoidia bacterium]|nr:hypothetical protein [Dehalococcoidia bacterium]
MDQSLQRGPVHILPGEPAILVDLGHLPAILAVEVHIRRAEFALPVE